MHQNGDPPLNATHTHPIHLQPLLSLLSLHTQTPTSQTVGSSTPIPCTHPGVNKSTATLATYHQPFFIRGFSTLPLVGRAAAAGGTCTAPPAAAPSRQSTEAAAATKGGSNNTRLNTQPRAGDRGTPIHIHAYTAGCWSQPAGLQRGAAISHLLLAS